MPAAQRNVGGGIEEYPAQYNDDDRKFAEKPNALKKVALDDIDEDIQTNQISDNGFSWTNMLGTLMTMFFNNAANNVGPNKSDDIDNGGGSGGLAPSPWANVISVGTCVYLFIFIILWSYGIELWEKRFCARLEVNFNGISFFSVC